MEVATTVAIYLFFSALFFIIVCAEYMNSLAKEKMPSKILFLAMLSSFGWCAVLLFVNMSVVVASLLTTMVLCISQSTISARRLKSATPQLKQGGL